MLYLPRPCIPYLGPTLFSEPAILLFSCLRFLFFSFSRFLVFSCPPIPLFSFSPVLLFSFLPILLYSYLPILLFSYFPILLFSYLPILSFSCTKYFSLISISSITHSFSCNSPYNLFFSIPKVGTKCLYSFYFSSKRWLIL